MAISQFHDEHKAKKHHDCTDCRSEICPNEYYKRLAVPPWANDGLYWWVEKKCQACW